MKGACSALVHQDECSARENSTEALHSEGRTSKERQVCDYPVFPATPLAAQISEWSFSIGGSFDSGSEKIVTLTRKDDAQPEYGTAWKMGRPVKAQEQRAAHDDRTGTDVSLITNIISVPKAEAISDEREIHGWRIGSHERSSLDDAE